MQAQASSFDEAAFQKILDHNPSTGKPVDSVAELVPLLPEELRENFTFVFESRSPFHASISPDFPRVILFTKDTRFVLTFTGNPDKQGYGLLETMWFNDQTRKFELKARILPAAVRKGERHDLRPQTCLRCHGQDPRPINDSYPLWPGFYGAVQDTFPPNLPSSRLEQKRYERFLRTQASRGVYGPLLYPRGSPVTPFLDPKDFDVEKIEGDLEKFDFLPNTRFGIALTELNRKRLFRKLEGSRGFAARKKEYLAELLDCGDSAVAEGDLARIRRLVKKENHDRLIRLGVDPTDPRQRVNDMQELKFTRELAQIDWLARESGLGREDWSLAMEKNSLSFFDGILSGMHEGKSFYLKEDFIFEFLRHLAETEPKYQPYFKTYNYYQEYGYPFGNRLQLGAARGACGLLNREIGEGEFRSPASLKSLWGDRTELVQP